MKSTPKSCSCPTCRAQHGRAYEREGRKIEERAFRRTQKHALTQGREADLVPAGVRLPAA